MTQNVQDLINKIKNEGVVEAENTAKHITEEAKKKADRLIKDAQSKAKAIQTQAEESAHKKEESTRAALRQAARDIILSLKQDIQSLLKKIVTRETGKTLSGDKLKGLVTEAIRSSSAKGDAIVGLREDDMRILSEGFITQLRDDLKKGVTFKPRTDRAKGFFVSFDEGKSSFDFTDEALADFFSGFARKDLSDLLKD